MQKRGRILNASEAQNVLETTSTRKTLMSWFDPFAEQMIDAIEKKKNTVILDGQVFNIKVSENGMDHIFSVVRGFVPMTRTSLRSLNERLTLMRNATASS